MSTGPPASLNPRLRQHPDGDKLRVNGNYFFDRMLASVSRPCTVAGEAAVLRRTAEQTHAEVRQLRSEVRELRRSLAGLQAQHGGSDDGSPSQATRPRIEIPPSVRRRRKVQR